MNQTFHLDDMFDFNLGEGDEKVQINYDLKLNKNQSRHSRSLKFPKMMSHKKSLESHWMPIMPQRVYLAFSFSLAHIHSRKIWTKNQGERPVWKLP